MKMSNYPRYLLLSAWLGLAGCAGTVTPPLSPEIATAPEDDPTLSDVRSQIESYKGQRVRWGGRVVGIGTDGESRWVRVEARHLDHNGQPDPSAPPLGHFRVHDMSNEPADRLETGIDVTVAGTFEGLRMENNEILPVVESNRVHVWRRYSNDAYRELSPKHVAHYEPAYYRRLIRPDDRYPYHHHAPSGFLYRYYPDRFPLHYLPPYARYRHGYGRFGEPFGYRYGHPGSRYYGYGPGARYLNFGFDFSN